MINARLSRVYHALVCSYNWSEVGQFLTIVHTAVQDRPEVGLSLHITTLFHDQIGTTQSVHGGSICIEYISMQEGDRGKPKVRKMTENIDSFSRRRMFIH